MVGCFHVNVFINIKATNFKTFYKFHYYSYVFFSITLYIMIENGCRDISFPVHGSLASQFRITLDNGLAVVMMTGFQVAFVFCCS